MRESFKEAPLEQTFPYKTQTSLTADHRPNFRERNAFIFPDGMFGSSLALFVTECPNLLGEAALLAFVLSIRSLSNIWTKKRSRHDSHKYNFRVARGWESKSVEEQQAEAVTAPGPAKPPLTAAQLANHRERQGLLLSRQHVMQQLEAASNPHHREVLQSALAELEKQLARMV